MKLSEQQKEIALRIAEQAIIECDETMQDINELRDQLTATRTALAAANEEIAALTRQKDELMKCVMVAHDLQGSMVSLTKLAAAEADNELLREAATAVLFNELDKVHMHPCDRHNRELQAKLAAPLLTSLYHVIFKPRDDSALRRLLAEAKAGVYEECANILGNLAKECIRTEEGNVMRTAYLCAYGDIKRLALAEKAKEER